MPWYTYLFIVMAIVALCGMCVHANRRNGHGMVYAAIVVAIWSALAVWTSGSVG